jgi:hypothetical protein
MVRCGLLARRVILGPKELAVWKEAQDSDESLEGVIRRDMFFAGDGLAGLARDRPSPGTSG